MNMNNAVLVTIAVIALIAIGYFFVSSNTGTTTTTTRPPMTMPVENFYNAPAASVTTSTPTQSSQPTQPNQYVDASESIQFIEQSQGLNMPSGTQLNQLPSECYPKDVLSSADLLPRDANSLWAQVNPSGQGSLADQNFLTSGFHIGINTVGQTLRNANRQLRSEPLNPQVKVSPWMQTTIEPDINRRPLEIQGDL
jgi:hypothetical protein